MGTRCQRQPDGMSIATPSDSQDMMDHGVEVLKGCKELNWHYSDIVSLLAAFLFVLYLFIIINVGNISTFSVILI
jgi:hypothetical protein